MLQSPVTLNMLNVMQRKERTMNAVIHHVRETGSTNELCTQAGKNGAPSWTVYTADCQTAGRGRLGRSWSSPAGTGLWFSVLLRPDLPASSAGLIPLAAALAVADGILTLTGLRCGIKWPNDVIVNRKKVCGILCESRFSGEALDFVTVGIGLNLYRGAYPAELNERATSLEECLSAVPGRESLLDGILASLESGIGLLEGKRERELLERYEKQCVTVGSRIRVSGGMEMTGIAEGIGAEGSLLVRSEDGTLRAVACGDVSVRGVMGYV